MYHFIVESMAALHYILRRGISAHPLQRLPRSRSSSSFPLCIYRSIAPPVGRVAHLESGSFSPFPSSPFSSALLCSPERGGLNGRLIFLSERDGDGDVDDDSRGESERGARSGRDDDHTNPPHSPSLPRVVPKGYSRQTVDRLFTKDVTTPN